MSNNYDDLMNAAKKKLEYEEKEDNLVTDDIYAQFREELDEEDEENTEGNNNGSKTKTLPVINSPEFEEEKEEYYIDPDDTPLFENGPGLSKVQLWKKEYGVNRVFHTKILSRDFVFRTLNRAEWEQIASLDLDSLTNEEVICATCVLWPLNYDYNKMGKESAGYPGTLAQVIMEHSGFTTDYAIEVL